MSAPPPSPPAPASAAAAAAAGDDDGATPFNPANKLLQEEALRRILMEYIPDASVLGAGGEYISDINVYRKAMTHRSYCTRKNENFLEGNLRCPPGCIPLQEESNERLEFLGDAVLNLVVGAYLFERFPDENEGFLTKMRTKLVNGGMLAQLCGMCGLCEWVIISRQLEDNAGRTNKKVMEDVFEAFLGALYLDHGFAAAQAWIINFIETHIDFSALVKQQTNYKDALSKYFQHTFGCLPKYSETAPPPADGEQNGDSQCTVCIKNKEGIVIGFARAANRKLAECEAAKRVLRYYGQEAQ